MTPDDLLTRKDLAEFKKELLAKGAPASPKGLKNKDAMGCCEFLRGMLQSLREKGTLAFSKVGGIYFYKLEDVDSSQLKSI